MLVTPAMGYLSYGCNDGTNSNTTANTIGDDASIKVASTTVGAYSTYADISATITYGLYDIGADGVAIATGNTTNITVDYGTSTTSLSAASSACQQNTTANLVGGVNDCRITGLAKNTDYYYNITIAGPNMDADFGTTNATTVFGTCSFSTSNPAIESDVLEGLPQVGSDTGDFLKNLAPGIGAFIIIMGVFGGVAGIIYAIVAVLKRRLGKGEEE